jgi:YtkA-like
LVASKLIVAISLVAVALGAIVVFTFMALSVSGNGGGLKMSFGGGMMGGGGMMMEGGKMQMPAPNDVIIMLESEYKMTAGKQSEVTLKILDKQTNEPVQGAQVIIGIEKGLPMTTMDMTGGGMFSATEKGNGTYALAFTPESKGYYTIHAHVIPPGKQMHSMMENHTDLLISSI